MPEPKFSVLRSFFFLILFSFPPILHAALFQEDTGVLYARGEFRQAESDLQDRLANDPKDQPLWLELAELRRSIGDDYGALEAYRACVEHGGNDRVRFAFAMTLLQMGRFEEAQAPLADLRARYPQDPDILWGLAQADYEKAGTEKMKWAAQQDLRGSKKALEALVAIKPRFAPAYWRMGQVLSLLGDDTGALAAYQTLLKKDQSYKKAQGLIAHLLQKLGRTQEALERYHRAVEVEPGNKALQKEAEEAAKAAPQEEKRRQSLRLAQWKRYSPPPVEPIATSPISIRVGLLTGMRRVLFRGQGELRVLHEGGTLDLKAGVDYQWIHRHKGQAEFWELLDRHNKVLLQFDKPIRFLSLDPRQALLIHAIPSGEGYFFAKEAEDLAYRGVMEVRPDPGKGFSLVNQVGLEDYCAGVLPSEMSPSWPMEALKAQAVAARGYVMSRLGGHASEGYDVVATVGDQVYRGITAEALRSNEAVRQTAGMVLKKGSHILKTVFSAECGGHTQDYLEAWGHDEPVVGVPDFDERYNQDMKFPLSPLHLKEWVEEDRVAWCRLYELRGYQNYRWVWMITAADLQAKAPEIGRLRRILVEKRSSAGWAKTLLVEGDLGVKRVYADSIRGFLGGLRSNLIWIETQRDPKGWPQEFTIYGGGWGHGVGLCQVGCYGLAKSGKGFEEILRHYFPKGTVEKLNN